jgi:hypothetical protein
MIGIVGIDHLHGSPGWRRFIAEQRNRLPEIPDKCLGIKTNVEVDIVRQQARRDADESRRIVARTPSDRFKAIFLPHGMEVAQKRFRQLASRTPRPAQLANELADLYPALAQKLVELLVRVAANDLKIDYINNQALPNGADRLLVAELKARGLQGFVVNSVEVPRIIDRLCLPPWQPRSNYLWATEQIVVAEAQKGFRG